MMLPDKCGGVAETKVAEATDAARTRLTAALGDYCRQAEEPEASGVHQALQARLDLFMDYFLEIYVRADLSATHHQRAYTRASTAVFSLGALAVIIVAAQYLFHLPHQLVAGEIVCIAAILLIFHLGNHRRWHRTWVDCRYFAERLRCGLYVAFLAGETGVADPPKWSARLVEGAWCNHEFLTLMRDRPQPEPLAENQLEVLRKILVVHWLQDQLNYHRSVALKKSQRHHVVSLIGETCFWLTLVAALIHLTPHDWRHAVHLDRILTDRVLTFVVIALPALGTALAGVRGHFEFKKVATRSRMITLELESLIAEAEAATDLAGLASVVRRAERLMIQENAGWHLHASDKEIPSEA